MTAPEAER